MQPTTISDSLPISMDVGTCGSLTVEWNDFTASDGTFVPSGSKMVTLSHNGTFSVDLIPTTGTENAYYTANFYLNSGSVLGSQKWTVPATTAVLKLAQVQVLKSIPPQPFQIQATQIYSANANIGDCLVFNGATFTPTTLQASFPFTFTNQANLLIPAAQHGQGSSLFCAVYDQSGNWMQPSIFVAPVVGDVTITFGSAQSGYGFLFGGLGRSLPNRAKGFYGVVSGTVLQAEHRFHSPYLAVSVLDSSGNIINSSAAIQIDPATFNVTVTLSSAQNFSVVVLGSLGTSTPVGVTSTPSTGGTDVPYLVPVTAQASVTISTSQHNKGIYPRADAFTNDSPPISATLSYTVDSGGNIIASFEPPFTGTIRVF